MKRTLARGLVLAFVAAITLTYTPVYADGEKVQYCNAHASLPSALGEKLPPPPEVECFDNFAESLAVGSGGVIRLPHDAVPADLTQELVDNAYAAARADGLAGDVVIGQDYKDSGFGGDILTWFATASDPDGCNGTNTHFQAHSMPAGWDNTVGSAISFSGCDTYVHFENTSLGGSQITCTCSSMGVMNDATSSESWAP